MIKVTCSQCGLQIYVPASVQGNRGVCFACGSTVQVPAQAAASQHHNLAFGRGDMIANRYRILERIGRGGMGVVYSAQDLLVGEHVALKFMNPLLLRTQAGQRLFIQEAQIARRLRHDHIVAVHDVGRLPEGILYLSMEFVQGKSLRQVLQKWRHEKRFPDVRLSVRIICQVLEALAYAHSRVVHRDMKPENILLLPGEWVKVLDFGLAKAVDAEAPFLDTAGRAARVVGTEAYASPEQKRRQNVDLRSDLYAVGLVFRELLTLRTPLDPPFDVAAVRDDVSPSLLAVLEKALQEDRDNRWQSASEFRRAISGAYQTSYEEIHVDRALAAPARQAATHDMVYLEGGGFLMGNNDVPEEAPEFEAYVESFYMDVFPVTVRKYAEFLQATGYPKPAFWDEKHLNGPDQPVVGVSWADAQEYCRWAGKELPTEIQWEYAARGKENRKYPWGVSQPDPTRANYGDHLNMPSIVGMHEDGATPEGIHDLAGNVYEWTRNWFRPYPLSESDAETSPVPPRRTVRGGSWHSRPSELRVTHRRGLFTETRDATVGFRCVVPVQRGVAPLP